MIHHICRKSDDGKTLLYSWTTAMHTRIDLLFCAEQSEECLVKISEEVSNEINRIEKFGSCFDPASEISKLNATKKSTPIVVSKELFQLLSVCKKYNKDTLGLFDITVGSEDYNSKTIEGLNFCEDNIISKEYDGIRIDLSGVLKGYALDCIKEIIKQRGISNALINMGNSSVLAIGLGINMKEDKGWNVGFPDLHDRIALHDECLTTSGNDSENRRHIINPRTGKMIEGKRQLAVITDCGTEGEVLSTALFIATAEERAMIASNFNIKKIIDISKT